MTTQPRKAGEFSFLLFFLAVS